MRRVSALRTRGRRVRVGCVTSIPSAAGARPAIRAVVSQTFGSRLWSFRQRARRCAMSAVARDRFPTQFSWRVNGRSLADTRHWPAGHKAVIGTASRRPFLEGLVPGSRRAHHRVALNFPQFGKAREYAFGPAYCKTAAISAKGSPVLFPRKSNEARRSPPLRGSLRSTRTRP